MQFIFLLDYLLLPIYLIIIYLIAIRFRNKHYPMGHPWRPYFLSGLTVKILGAIFIGLIYQYYYGGGDTSNYYFEGRVINSAASESLTKWINMILHTPQWYDGDYLYYIRQFGDWYNSPSEYIVGVISALVGVFTFTTYLPTCIIFAALSFTGMWALFRLFATQYPYSMKAIAIAMLYIPSVALWGSGIFKDTICLAAVGWMTYGVFRMLVVRDISARNIIATIISFYLLEVIKIYILLAYVPALFLWIFFNYVHKIRSGAMRFILRILVVGIAGVGFIYVTNKFADILGRYSLAQVAQTSYTTKEWITTASQQGGADNSSRYDLGEFEPSIQSMLTKFPAAVNVTLFRPYIWEARKIITILSSLEAMAFLLLTLKILIYVGPIKAWAAIRKDPNIQFCLIFTIIFAFAVGISSFNFGALSRYRIPCLPFYALALILIFYRYNPPEKNIFSFRR